MNFKKIGKAALTGLIAAALAAGLAGCGKEPSLVIHALSVHV